jgi:hypothetical protein
MEHFTLISFGKNEEEYLNYFNLENVNHQSSKPPEIAFRYFPTREEEVFVEINKPKQITRKIFEGMAQLNLTDLEKEKLKELNELISKNYVNQDLKVISEGEKLRFLQAASYDSSKAMSSILNTFQWHVKTFPIKINANILNILNSGFVYFYGRDLRFRPNLIICPAKFTSGLYHEDDWKYAMIYLLKYFTRHMSLPGQIENWNIICNLKNIPFSIPKELTSIRQVITEHFKCRLNTMFVVNLPTMASFIWSVAKKMLGPAVEKKLKMISSYNNYAELKTFVSKNQLEKKFGGILNDIEEGEYFPPRMPEFNTSSLDNPDILISIEDYEELLKNPTISHLHNKTNFSKHNSNKVQSKIEINDKGNLLVNDEEYYSARETLRTHSNLNIAKLNSKNVLPIINKYDLSPISELKENKSFFSSISNNPNNDSQIDDLIRVKGEKRSINTNSNKLLRKSTNMNNSDSFEIKIEKEEKSRCAYLCNSKGSCILF